MSDEKPNALTLTPWMRQATQPDAAKQSRRELLLDRLGWTKLADNDHQRDEHREEEQ